MGPRSYTPTLFFFSGGDPYDTITECNAHCGKEPWKNSRCEPFCGERLQASYDLLGAKPLPAPASAWQPGPVATPDYFAMPTGPPKACNTKACLATGELTVHEAGLGALATIAVAAPSPSPPSRSSPGRTRARWGAHRAPAARRPAAARGRSFL